MKKFRKRETKDGLYIHTQELYAVHRISPNIKYEILAELQTQDKQIMLYKVPAGIRIK